ncbi:hypothetical protein DYU05_15940 [Mucilaginibacter terrenus]|uniref:Uncharacterized protein n=1 Tax=Mucilaginibacter terrenus TaxID=2482727 RepID=A0A3E2NMB8_9SPHI|nr:hypothetical protein [Mucilaginibacter terrenus]RFZ82112.1 hypothetical protein DYU05_15940 [Mucilaginibacter terrenus]
MKYHLFVFLILFSLLSACASKKNIIVASGNKQDGMSYATAIVLQEKDETTGIHAEYAWLKSHYPGYKTQSQSLASKDKRSYDIIHILTAEGKEMDVYFDISGFFGKF